MENHFFGIAKLMILSSPFFPCALSCKMGRPLAILQLTRFEPADLIMQKKKTTKTKN